MSFKAFFLIVLGLGFLYALFTIGFPFLLAIVVAILIEPVNLLLMKYTGMKRLASSSIVCSLFTVVVLGLGYLIGLKLYSEMIEFSRKIPAYLNELSDIFQSANQKTKLFYETLPEDTALQLQKGVESGIRALTDSLNGMISGFSGSFIDAAKAIPNMLIFFVVFIVALFLFSYSLKTMKVSFLSLFDDNSHDKIEKVLINLRASIGGFLRAQLLLSALTYLVVLLGFLILGVKYSLVIALLIVIVDILPILGTGSVLVPWATVSFITGDNFLGFGLIFLFIMITIFRRTIEPKVIGDSLGIGALPTLISLYIGFKLVGLIGLFLGPIVVMIYYAMRKVGLLNFKIKIE